MYLYLNIYTYSYIHMFIYMYYTCIHIYIYVSVHIHILMYQCIYIYHMGAYLYIYISYGRRLQTIPSGKGPPFRSLLSDPALIRDKVISPAYYRGGRRFYYQGVGITYTNRIILYINILKYVCIRTSIFMYVYM